MGQVPEKEKQDIIYGIVGKGRVAKHFIHYFKSLNINFKTWTRSDGLSCEEALSLVDVMLVLITDWQIEKFISEQTSLRHKKWVHFSGSLFTPMAFGAHPLMTFSNDLYDNDFYQRIPFVTDDTNGSFKELFPALKNLSVKISPELKPLYHALCVMAGNFTTLLWQKAFVDFREKLGLSPEILVPYLNQTVINLIQNPLNALSGPLARNDTQTLAKNIRALDGDPYQVIYESFVTAHASQPKG